MRYRAFLSSVFLLASLSSGAWPETLQQGSGPDRLVLQREAGVSWLERGDGTRVDIPDRADSRWSSLVVASGQGWLAGEASGAEGRTRLKGLKLSVEGKLESVEMPATAAHRFQRHPALVAESGSLRGLVWLEGTDPEELGIWASERENGDWKKRHRVMARGPGSQMGLSAVGLADGGWIAVWSRFDGEDNEIFWALRTPDGEWTAGAPVAEDHTPDLLPQIARQGAAAVLAWVRFDGREYRIATATWQGAAWSAPRWASPAGSVHPQLIDSPGGALLSYQQVLPRAWVTTRLDQQGQPKQAVSLATESDVRPGLELTSTGVRFEWSGKGAPVELPWGALR